MAEIGGRVRSGISMLQSNLAVAEISKIASSLLPFCQEEADKGEPIVGATKEVLVFVRHISTRPETWLDFPLVISERYADGKVRFHLSSISPSHISSYLISFTICAARMRSAGRKGALRGRRPEKVGGMQRTGGDPICSSIYKRHRAVPVKSSSRTPSTSASPTWRPHL
jgi:hypothetical protein